MERKSVSFELKEVGEDGTFSGYGAVFGNTDLGRDIIEPGAFTRTLNEHRSRGTRVAMLAGHNPDEVIGLWNSLQEDRRGLFVEGRLITDVQKARETHVLMKEDAISGLSIGFRPTEFEFDQDGIRRIKDVDLFEVSVVAIPMNQDARISSVKALLDELDSMSEDDRALLRKRLEADVESLGREELEALDTVEMERALRERRPSQRAAKYITSLVQRDVAPQKADQRDVEKAESKQRDADHEHKQRAADEFAKRLASLHNQIRS